VDGKVKTGLHMIRMDTRAESGAKFYIGHLQAILIIHILFFYLLHNLVVVLTIKAITLKIFKIGVLSLQLLQADIVGPFLDLCGWSNRTR